MVLEPLRIFGRGMVNILCAITLRNFAKTVDFCANDSAEVQPILTSKILCAKKAPLHFQQSTILVVIFWQFSVLVQV